MLKYLKFIFCGGVICLMGCDNAVNKTTGNPVVAHVLDFAGLDQLDAGTREWLSSKKTSINIGYASKSDEFFEAEAIKIMPMDAQEEDFILAKRTLMSYVLSVDLAISKYSKDHFYGDVKIYNRKGQACSAAHRVDFYRLSTNDSVDTYRSQIRKNNLGKWVYFSDSEMSVSDSDKVVLPICDEEFKIEITTPTSQFK